MSHRQQLLAISLLSIFLLAVGLRFYQLPTTPSGILPETANVIDEVRATHRGHQPQTVFGSVAALLLAKTFSSWQVAAVAGGISLLTVLLVFTATRMWFGNLAALIAAYLMATSVWQVVASRSGTPVVLIPFAVALLLAGSSWLLKKTTGPWQRAVGVGLLTALSAALLLATLHPYRAAGFEPVSLGALLTWQELPAALTAALSPWPALLATPLFIAAGVLLTKVARLIARRLKAEQYRAVVWGVLGGLLITWGVYGTTVLLVILPNDSSVANYYQADLVDLPTLVAELASQTTSISIVADEATTRLLQTVVADQAWRPVPPSSSHLLVLREGDVVIFTRGSLVAADRFERKQPRATQLERTRNHFGHEIRRVYQFGGVVDGVQDVQPEPVHSGLDA